MTDTWDIRVLAGLEPISSVPPGRHPELLDYCRVESVPAGADPFEVNGLEGQSVYLVHGQLEVAYEDGSREVMNAGSEPARHPLGKRRPAIAMARALAPTMLLRIDDDLLDKVVTWGQFSLNDGVESILSSAGSRVNVAPGDAKRLLDSAMFAAEHLKRGPFAHLPPANIGRLLSCIEAVEVEADDVVIREGDIGDCYFMIESGRAQVTRLVGSGSTVLADLRAGDVFGEEALVSGARRNASVTMKSDGILYCLKQPDFLELMQEPLLQKMSYDHATRAVDEGAIWLDARQPQEYRYDRMPGAINAPLSDIRQAIGALNREKKYIAYCQSGRRSSAAAFILAQSGYDVSVLDGGLWALPKTDQRES